MYSAVSEVCRASFWKFTVSELAEILEIKENVVKIRVQLVNGIKKPSASMYRK
jgi:hypothetical protein